VNLLRYISICDRFGPRLAVEGLISVNLTIDGFGPDWSEELTEEQRAFAFVGA
jgi:hypothetical protein